MTEPPPFEIDLKRSYDADLREIARLGREAIALQAEAAEIVRVRALRRKQRRGVADLIAAWERPLPAHDEKLVASEAVVAAVREHALSALPGREIVGALLVRRGIAVAYQPLANRTTAPGKARFSWPPKHAAETAYAVHSHPAGAPSTPSAGDVAGCPARELGRPYFVFSAGTNELHGFVIKADRSGWSEAPFSIVAAAPRTGPTIDPRIEKQLADQIVADRKMRAEAGVVTASAAPVPPLGRFTIDYKRGVVLDRAGQFVPGGFETLSAYLRGDVGSRSARGRRVSDTLLGEVET